MSIRAVAHIISYLVGVVALAMLPGVLISLGCGERGAAAGLFAAFAVSAATAGAVFALTRGPVDLGRRDGFAVATLGWLSVSAFGALPYIFSGVITDPLSALFETVSGFTTTGASVLTNLESIPRGIIFWRAMTQFFGGMGVLVLCVAILPFLKVGGVQIYSAEMPGPTKDRLTPRISATAKLLWGAYLSFCVVQTMLLVLGGMPLLDAWCHACATMATGGFSSRTASIGAYNSVYVETVIVVFMFLAGTSFVLHLKMLRGRPFEYFRDAEFRFYALVWFAACMVIAVNVWGRPYASFPEALRAAVFQGTSIMTTTGFATEDFNLWPQTSRLLLLLLMFMGGCAGSTAGGAKQIRIVAGIKALARETFVYMRPDAVKTLRIGGENLKDKTVWNICVFLMAFVLLFAVGSLAMSFHTPDLLTAASSAMACLANIGPGFGAVGPVENYAAIPGGGKGILIALMLLGRLEIFTVLVLFFPSFWKK